MKIHFDPPTGGTERELLAWCRKISMDLTIALANIDGDNMSPAARESLTSADAAGEKIERAARGTAAELRSLIIKSGEVIHHEIETVERTLREEMLYRSEWGQLEETVRSTVTETARGIVESYDYDSRISDVAEGVADLREFEIRSDGTIRRGIIGYDGAVPVIGIAIGQEIRTSGTDTVDGVTYDVIDMTSNMGVYTAKGLSFYVNGVEVAYLKDRRLYISDAKVTGDLEQGKWRWENNELKGLTLRWIG